jgi:hypothetical protein
MGGAACGMHPRMVAMPRYREQFESREEILQWVQHRRAANGGQRVSRGPRVEGEPERWREEQITGDDGILTSVNRLTGMDPFGEAERAPCTDHQAARTQTIMWWPRRVKG